MLIKPTLHVQYDAIKNNSKNDPYGSSVLDFTEAYIDALEQSIAKHLPESILLKSGLQSYNNRIIEDLEIASKDIIFELADIYKPNIQFVQTCHSVIIRYWLLQKYMPDADSLKFMVDHLTDATNLDLFMDGIKIVTDVTRDVSSEDPLEAPGDSCSNL